MVITIIMNTRSQTKEAQEAQKFDVYSTLFSELVHIEGEMVKENWHEAIKRLLRATVALSQLPLTDRLGMMKGNIHGLMSECILKAPTSVLEQPILERRFDSKRGQHVKVAVVPFSVAGSPEDPFCSCATYYGKTGCGVEHWCAWCADLDPKKYTVGGLLAYKASQYV